jgi:glycosyltransferase involved in cell wall biosynthesis
MICRDEAAVIEETLLAVKPYISHWTIVDTGSTDKTKALVRKTLKGVPGKLYERPWVDFSTNRNEALELAEKTAEWLLLLDADMSVEIHPDLLSWLAGDPDPTVDAWMLEIVDGALRWRMPFLVRGFREWRYIGPVHEYLDISQVKTRPLLGLTLRHRGNGRNPIVKWDQYLSLLKPGLEAGDPRAVFYSAECLRLLGCIPQAIELYEQRATLNGFEEEAWYAAYKAAHLKGSVPELLEAFNRRPWRSEPLQAAADLVRSIHSEDVLFHGG